MRTKPKAQTAPHNWKRITRQMSDGLYLVTNNLKATDAQGRKSHVWLTSFIQKSDDPDTYGRFICFDENDRIKWNLSHFIEVTSLATEPK